MEQQIDSQKNLEPPYPPRRQHSPLHKTPMLAGVLSLIPGLGNVYNGIYQRGIVFFVIWVALFSLAVTSQGGGDTAVLVPALVFFWFFNIFDAYRQATLINFGYATDGGVDGLQDLPKVGSVRSGGLLAGVALVLVGLYGFLEDRFDFDLTWLVDNWYVMVMAFGGWLIFQTLRQRRAEENGGSELDLSNEDSALMDE